MSINATNYTSIFASSTTNFGGVMKINSMGVLNMTNVIASNFLVSQSTATNGGGSFLYTNYDGLFYLNITTSQFSCVNFVYSSGEIGTVNSLAV
jgi:hypothetical protein